MGVAGAARAEVRDVAVPGANGVEGAAEAAPAVGNHVISSCNSSPPPPSPNRVISPPQAVDIRDTFPSKHPAGREQKY